MVTKLPADGHQKEPSSDVVVNICGVLNNLVTCSSLAARDITYFDGIPKLISIKESANSRWISTEDIYTFYDMATWAKCYTKYRRCSLNWFFFFFFVQALGRWKQLKQQPQFSATCSSTRNCTNSSNRWVLHNNKIKNAILMDGQFSIREFLHSRMCCRWLNRENTRS